MKHVAKTKSRNHSHISKSHINSACVIIYLISLIAGRSSNTRNKLEQLSNNDLHERLESYITRPFQHIFNSPRAATKSVADIRKRGRGRLGEAISGT